MKIYLASPLDHDKRQAISFAAGILRDKGFDVYVPVEHQIPNAWDYPNDEWGLMVFQADVNAIMASDAIVLLSYGRASTAGTNWEAGFAFGIGKKVIIVEMLADGEIMSLMVANGRYATVEGLNGLQNYDWETMPKSRTKTEQK